MTFKAKQRVDASARTFTIIEHLADGGPRGISAMATELDMNKGIVHNHVSTLRELGYVSKVGDDYQLSPKFLFIGHQTRNISPLYQAAVDVIESYDNQSKGGVVVLQRAGKEGVVIYGQGNLLVPELKVGKATPLSSSLPGIVLLLATDLHNTIDPVYDISSFETEFENNHLIQGSITPDRTVDCIAAPITTNGVCHGSLGLLSEDSSNVSNPAESITTLRDEIETVLSKDDSHGRSFVSEKHSWYTE